MLEIFEYYNSLFSTIIKCVTELPVLYAIIFLLAIMPAKRR